MERLSGYLLGTIYQKAQPKRALKAHKAFIQNQVKLLIF
jgi:hypothetical protein